MAEAKKIIAVDFDGTLCTNEWPAIGLPRKTIIDYVLDQQKQGAKLILWTNRNGDRLLDAVMWCTRFGIHFDAVNENLPEVVERYGADTRKVYADEYIDDRAFSAFNQPVEQVNDLGVTELVKSAHQNAVQHGFWEDPPDFGTSIALIHSELSEALEEVRAGNRIRPGSPTPPVYYSGNEFVATAPTLTCNKPEGYAVELADAVIRIADLCGYMGIDLATVLREKMAYNTTRPYKHGKKF